MIEITGGNPSRGPFPGHEDRVNDTLAIGPVGGRIRYPALSLRAAVTGRVAGRAGGVSVALSSASYPMAPMSSLPSHLREHFGHRIRGNPFGQMTSIAAKPQAGNADRAANSGGAGYCPCASDAVGIARCAGEATTEARDDAWRAYCHARAGAERTARSAAAAIKSFVGHRYPVQCR